MYYEVQFFLVQMLVSVILVCPEKCFEYIKVYIYIQDAIFYFQEFRLLHFAGEVTYSIQGFLDKNNDLLFRDLKEVFDTLS